MPTTPRPDTNPAAWLDMKLTKAERQGHPFAELVTVTSPLAQELLQRNKSNRPLRQRRALRYREDMEAGAWEANGEAIIIGLDGSTLNGQHRAHAIADTELAVPMFLMFGVRPEARFTMDQGATRTAGDAMAIEGVDNASTAAGIARLRVAYERNERAALKDTAKPTNAQIRRYYADHKTDVDMSAALAKGLAEFSRPLVATAVLGFCHNVLHDIDPAAADAFITQVAKGEDLHEGDAAFAVRTRLLKMGKTGAAKKAEVIFAGFKAFQEGRKLKSIRVSGTLPELRPN